MRNTKERQDPRDPIKSKRQKSERPVCVTPAHSPSHQERQYLASYQNRSHLHETQNPVGQPQTGQQLNMALHAPIGGRSSSVRRGRNRRGAGCFAACTAELRTGTYGRSEFIAKHGRSSVCYRYARRVKKVSFHVSWPSYRRSYMRSVSRG